MEGVKNSNERSAGWLCFLSMVCFVIILVGILYMAILSFLRGDIGFGLLMIGGEGVLLFLASVVMWIVGKAEEVEKYVGM
ncbi:MAG: hypothetical protein WC343_10520 [Bacilli bacterium]|jgi:uncharacterized Tic20 family protein